MKVMRIVAAFVLASVLAGCGYNEIQTKDEAIKGAWAEVYFKGKDLGRNYTMSGLTPFHLPVGKQTLVLENTPAHKKKTITIDVTEGTKDITETLE